MTIPHAVVWLDHHDALICFLPGDDQPFTRQHLGAHGAHGHNGGHASEESRRRFFQDIAQSLGEVSEVLVVGPAQAKHEFYEFASVHNPGLRRRILAVENADHPTAAQLVARARPFFKKADAMDGKFHLDLDR